MAKPVTTIGDDSAEAVIPPGDAVAVYNLTTAPPFNSGGLNAIVTFPPPAVTFLMIGAEGGPAGVIEVEYADG